jgi:N-formylglutamate amidohydrolase
MHGRMRPDIVLGDRYGTSCSSELTDFAARVLSGLGYSVSRNKPYAGGFITEHYGQPGRGLHAMQIEFNRNLYMDERTLQKTPRFDTLATDLVKFVAALTEAFDDGFLAGREAAE